MNLRKTAETTVSITLGWDPVPCEGYLFFKDGVRVSRTFDPARNSVKFSKPYQSLGVQAIVFTVVNEGTYPGSTPPPVTYKKVAPRVAYQADASDARYCLFEPNGQLRPGLAWIDAANHAAGVRDEVAQYDLNGLCLGAERTGGSAADGIVSAKEIDGRPLCELPMTGDPTQNTGSWKV
jgi:hypothetical protein